MENFIDLMRHSYTFDENLIKNDKDWNLINSCYSKSVLDENQPLIPKKIHQIWLGGSLPDQYYKLTETWKTFNPDFEYKLWTDNDVKNLDLKNRKIYENVENNGVKSDILRYEIINQFGGIYADTDFECIKPFSDFLSLSFFSGLIFNKNVEIAIGLFGSIPNHPILNDCIDKMHFIGEKDWRDIFNSTGTYFFTKQFLNNINENTNNIVAFPTIYFYPFPNSHRSSDLLGFNEDDKKQINNFLQNSESYAIHWWHTSWKWW